MTSNRLKYLEQFPNSCTERDIESLEALMLRFPFFSTPFVILAKVYHDQQNYKASEILKKASLRVFNRAELYNYIHSESTTTNMASEKEVPESNSILSEGKLESPELECDNSSSEERGEIIQSEEGKISLDVSEYEGPLNDENDVEEQKVVSEKAAELNTTEDSIIKETLQNIDFTTNKPSETIHENANVFLEIPEENKFEKEVLYGNNHAENQKEHTNLSPPENNEEINKSTEVSNTPANFFDWINKMDSSEPEEIKTSIHYSVSTEEEEIQLINTLPSNKSRGFSLPASEAIDLIDEFIRKSPQISRPKKEFFKAEKVAQKSLELSNEIVTETLAAIYAKQGHWEQAISAYQKLSLKFPQKQTYFAAIIEELKIKKES